MDRFNTILSNYKYKGYVAKLEELENERVFCNHTIEHFLDVARIAYIQVLERGLDYSKDVIYAIALLHDIGRVLQYTKGIEHDEGSVILAKEILPETDYLDSEVEIILKAILNHRNETEDELSKIIYSSDKLSRNCFKCKAENECYWSKEKKNFHIKY